MSSGKSEPPDPESAGEASGESSGESSCEPSGEAEFNSLVRGALQDAKPAPDILGDVQKRLRKESEGRFYADGWSVEREPPVRTFLITSLGMLAVAVAVYVLITVPASPPDRVRLAPIAAEPGSD